MKRTALILAGAAAFDLGVMAVAVQAQTPPTTRSDEFVNQGLITNSNSKLTAQDRQPASPGTASGAAVVDPTGPGGNGGCTPGGPIPGGRPNPCPPPAISDQAAAGNLTSFARTNPSGGQWNSSGHREQKQEAAIYIKLDRVNTIQACTARGGEVVPHQGAQHCRIPPPAAPVVGNPTLPRPGGIPPRN